VTTRASRGRLGLATVVALGTVVAFAALGGTSLAGDLAKKPKPAKAQYAPGQYANGAKVTICHKGKVTIRISVAALKAHVKHPATTLGPCPESAAAAATTAKKGKKAANENVSSQSNASSGKKKNK
jgi:hypothetical protein